MCEGCKGWTMGVRGKVEAVIYAAEEPVTLAQLVALFGEEALTERMAVVRQALMGTEAAEPSTSISEVPGNQSPTLEPYPAHGEPVLIGDPDADKRATRLRDRESRECVSSILRNLMAEYSSDGRGMELREIAGGYRIGTKPEYHEAVRAFVKSQKPVMKLTLQALETLAVIAYKQPVTAPEVAEIRGVDSGGVLGSLVSRKLVTTAGRKPVVGRPILYKTTKEFLLRFGLKDLAELPSMEEFEKMAGELGPEDMMNEQPEHSRQPGEIEKIETINEPEQLPADEPAQGEMPTLAPSAIVVTVEKPVLPGISVTLSGTARPDPGSIAKPQGDRNG